MTVLRRLDAVLEQSEQKSNRDQGVARCGAGGIDGFIRREVLEHEPDAWIDVSKTDALATLMDTREPHSRRAQLRGQLCTSGANRRRMHGRELVLKTSLVVTGLHGGPLRRRGSQITEPFR
jgi:hypothetical protein